MAVATPSSPPPSWQSPCPCNPKLWPVCCRCSNLASLKVNGMGMGFARLAWHQLDCHGIAAISAAKYQGEKGTLQLVNACNKLYQVVYQVCMLLQVACVLLPLSFAYDVFWVFIQPHLTHGDSVMVKVCSTRLAVSTCAWNSSH